VSLFKFTSATQTGLKTIFNQSGTLFLTAIWVCHGFSIPPTSFTDF